MTPLEYVELPLGDIYFVLEELYEDAVCELERATDGPAFERARRRVSALAHCLDWARNLR